MIYALLLCEILDPCQENWSHPTSQSITSPGQHLGTTNSGQQHVLMKGDGDEKGR